MNEFIEKLIGRLENRIKYNELCHKEFPNAKMNFTYEVQINAYKNAIEIVNQLAEEYINCSTNISTDKSTTNADRIRSMSDEELAKFIRAVECCSRYSADCGFPFCPSMEGNLCNGIKEKTEQYILDWLQSEVKGSE